MKRGKTAGTFFRFSFTVNVYTNPAQKRFLLIHTAGYADNLYAFQNQDKAQKIGLWSEDQSLMPTGTGFFNTSGTPAVVGN